jgi:2-polyprenyl-3-methyl-5-hydroxy-6-metoxy-1,4-benzoquinol methylase
MKVNARISTEELLVCLLCGRHGKILHAGLRDRLFGAPGEWDLLKCAECGLIWLNPRPVPADLHKIYKEYFTHRQNGRSAFRQKTKRALYATLPGYENLATSWFWRMIGKGVALPSLMSERARLGTMCLGGNSKGRLLDIGCGGGEFLVIMRDAGWDVAGIEPDPIAADLARRRGIPVLGVDLAEAHFPDACFDAITLNHVIEHVYDPVALLAGCHRVLADNGKIVVTTPNIQARGYQVFGSSWVALDPPRHLFLYSSQALRICCEKAGLHVSMSKSATRNAQWNYALSASISRRHRLVTKVRAFGFLLQEEFEIRSNPMAGDELVTIADKI